MKRQLSAFLAIVFLAVLFSGCGPDNVDEMSTTGVPALPPDTTAPTILNTFPTGTNEPLTTQIIVTFSEPVVNVDATSFTVTGSGTPIAGTITPTGAGTTFTFKPSAALLPSTTYTVTLSASSAAGPVADLAGNPLASGTTWTFSTGAAADTTPPTVLSTTPTGANVPSDLSGTSITATFSEQINCATITTTSFYMINSTSTIPGSVSCNSLSATFTPTSPLADNTLYTVTLTTVVTDLAGNHLALKTWTFTTTTPSVTSSSTLPPATVGGTYLQQLLASGGTGTLSWSATGLPSGLSISSSGSITGSPTVTGSAIPVTVTVTDAFGGTATKTFSLTVNAAPSITSPTSGTTVPAATTGGAYTLSGLLASGGTGTLTWSATGLPAGLSFKPSTGLTSSLTGTVTDVPNSYPIDLTVTDANLVTSLPVTITLVVNAAPTITTVSPITGVWTQGAAATVTLSAINGTGTYTWSSTDLTAVVPAWLSLNGSTGVLSGTAPAPGTSAAYTFHITVKDSNNVSTTMPFEVDVP